MAKLLFINIPAHGHVNPTLPLVAALRKAGHRVDYLLTEEFRKKVEYCGAGLIPLEGPEYLGLKGFWSRLFRVRSLFRSIRLKAVELAPGYDAFVVGGMYPAVAELEAATGKPAAFCSAMFLHDEATIARMFTKAWGIPAIVRFVARRKWLRRLFSRLVFTPLLGLPIRDLLVSFGPQSPSLNIVFTSAFFQPDSERFAGCRFIGPTPTLAAGAADFPLEALRPAGKKLVYASLGTVFNTWLGFFRAVIEAFGGDPGFRVVMSVGNAERLRALGPVPDNFIVREFVPQAEVLSRADLFIAHGGMGSVSDGISLGVPMIIVPLGADQFFNAYRLRELGAARVLRKAEVTPRRLRLEAESVWADPEIAANIEKVRRSFRDSGGPAEAVAAIEGLLSRS